MGAALRLLSIVPGPSFEDLPLDKARAQIDAEAAVFRGPPIPKVDDSFDPKGKGVITTFGF